MFGLRYFKESEECRTHMYTYWHEVLAKYFENNHDDMDRKAEVNRVC